MSSRVRSRNTLQERVANGRLLEAAFGPAATDVFKRTEHVHIVACGTSYHAASVARYLIEQICKLPCSVEIASEYRYRSPVVLKNSLFVTISAVRRNGGHAGGAARWRRRAGYLSSLAICNVPESSLVRESELVHAHARGPGDRCRVDQGVHHAARGAEHADHRARAHCTARS